MYILIVHVVMVHTCCDGVYIHVVVLVQVSMDAGSVCGAAASGGAAALLSEGAGPRGHAGWHGAHDSTEILRHHLGLQG